MTQRVAKLTYPGTETVIGYCVYTDGQSNMLYSWIFPQMFSTELGACLYGMYLKAVFNALECGVGKNGPWSEANCIAYADEVRHFMLARFGEDPEKSDEYWQVLSMPTNDVLWMEFDSWRKANQKKEFSHVS